MKQILFSLAVLLASLSAMAQPVITQPPANQAVALGGTLTLNVTASGTTPAYQWFKDSRLILGATNSTLTVLNAGVTNSGTYYVVVTNAGGMVISLPASVTVGISSLLAWGYNNDGQLGNGTMNNTSLPIVVAGNVVAGAAGYEHSLFVTADGRLWAMGLNTSGQLGNGTQNNTTSPVNVASNVVAAAAGEYHSLFVKADGTLWAMGNNGNGELGNGTTSNTNRPVSVASNVVAVAAGGLYSLFVKEDGSLWAMGYNYYGQLGNGTTASTNLPVNVASNVVAVAAGGWHSLFVKRDGTLWAMGLNASGQLGNGTAGSNPNPTPISVASNVVAVAAGYQHSLFADTNGTLWAMGFNEYGQLGNGTNSNTDLPVSVASNVVALAAGYYHSLFTKADGTLWTMGYNGYGQLGNGTTSNTNLPVCVTNQSVANIFPADQANHSLALGINYHATVTLTNLNQAYTGNAISVTASTIPAGLAIILTYNGSPNAPTNAGSYTVIGAISNLNYYGSATNTLVINPSAATVTLGNLKQAYTGSAISATASTTPPGLTVNLTYNGSTNAPTNPGSYIVIGTISTPNYAGSATNTLVITGPTVVPANQVVAAGGTETLSLTVSNTALAYQWFKDSRLILGATNSTLTVLNAGVTNSGTYYVVVTNGNRMFISLPALVTVGSPSLLAWGYNAYGQLGNDTTNNALTPINVAGNVVAGAAGGNHSLFVDTNGTLWAMGWNNYGQLGNSITNNCLMPVSVASNVVAVAAGYQHSLFVDTNGTLWAMGLNSSGQLGNGTAGSNPNPTPISVASNVVAVAAGNSHSLFLKTDGTLWAMGYNGYGQLGNGNTSEANTPINVASNVVAVAAGGWHSLFVTANGTLCAMGLNNYGQLGNGTTSEANSPISVASNVVAAAAGSYHSMFVDTNGILWTMGYNTYGQLGYGWWVNSTNRPVSVASNVVAVAAGYGHSLFTMTDGTLWAMGFNNYGQLGNGNPGTNSWPLSVPQPFVANIFPADQANHSLAIGCMKTFAAVTLGNLNQAYTGNAINVTATTTPPGLMVNLTYNGSTNMPASPGSYTVIGTISDPNYYGSATNTLVITPLTVAPASQAVAVGGTMTMGVTVSGTAPAYQWFKDSRLIVGATNSTLTVLNAGVTNSGTYYVMVTNVGGSSGMVISLPASVAVGNPSLLAWGLNAYGQLGNGTASGNNPNPTPIVVAGNVVAGAAGESHSLFVDTNGTLWGMGNNFNNGQLGNNPDFDYTPVNVANNVVAVAAGFEHSLFVDTNGTLWAMGYNYFGQLGYTTLNPSPSFFNPIPTNVASGVAAVAAGSDHSLFVKMDGTLWGMGYNYYGQLGNGTTSEPNTPISVANNVVAVAAGWDHSLFVTADGKLWAMGLNNYGQLGNGTLNNVYTPISVASNVVAVAAGGYHSLFVTADGMLWAMGLNSSGQLGNGTTTQANTPITVASNVMAVAAGEYHSLFVKTDGTLWAMGLNSSGQLGNGTMNNTSLPVSVPHMPVANIFPADTADHSLAIGINYNATVTLGNLNQAYTGSAINVTASTTPPGLTVNLTYNGTPNAPTNAGSYTVVGVISDPNYYGSATNTLVINPNATVTLGGLNQPYTGSAISVTAVTTPPGLTVNLTYNGSPNAPTNAGSYTVIGVISTPGYAGSATNTLVVGLPPQSFTAGMAGSVNGQQLTLQLTGTPNYPYILQSATNLTPPINWQCVFTNCADTNGNWSFCVTNLTVLPGCFYRAVAQ